MEGTRGGGEGKEGGEEEGREGKRRGGWREGVKEREDEGKGKGWGGELVPPPHMTCLRHAPASIEAAEKRPLSYQTPQSVHCLVKLWCSDLAIDNALWG